MVCISGCIRGCISHLGTRKPHHLDVSPIVNHHVLRLEIAISDVEFVHVGKG